MADASYDGHEAVTERVRELVEALKNVPPVARYRAAEERFRADAELQRLQSGLRWSHQQLRKAEREGRYDARLFQEVRDGQARLQRHPLVVEFVAARQEARDLLRETNDVMTEVLGVDIGGSVGRSGGCC